MVTRPDLGGAGLVFEDGLSLHNPIVAALTAQFPIFFGSGSAVLHRHAHYSKTRVAVSKGNTLKWLFPQEKATFEVLDKGTFTLVLL
jgi:hypothetical protein